MIPYTYLLRHLPSGQVYYGVRYAKNCRPADFWSAYFTSSKHVKDLIDRDGTESFTFQIRKTFDSVDKARKWEERVLTKMDVIKHPRFINKTTNKSISPECASKAQKGKTGVLSNKYGVKNKKLSELNKLKVGDKNPMFGKTGELAPNYGRTGSKHPMFGKSNPKSKETISRKGRCIFCGSEANIQNIARWHNNNCKRKNI